MVALHGACRVHLDDGRTTQPVALDDPGQGPLCRHVGVARAHGFHAAGGGPGDRLDALRRGRVFARLRGLQARSGGEDGMIPFLDMKAVYAELKPELDAAYARVMESGWFVLGKEVEAFEAEYAAFCGTSALRRPGQRAGGARAELARLGSRRRRRGDRAVQHLYRDLARGDGGGRQGRAGRADARRAQHRSRSHRRRDHAAHPGDHAGPSLRRAGRHGRHHGAGPQARAQGGRGRGAGAGRQGARPADRRAGSRRRAQLLPDQEFRRLRRWRRGHHRRCPAGRAAARAAQLRQPREVREPGARLQFAARRDAGRLPARQAAAARCLERAPPPAGCPLRRQACGHSGPRPAARPAMGRAGVASLRRAHRGVAPN